MPPPPQKKNVPLFDQQLNESLLFDFQIYYLKKAYINVDLETKIVDIYEKLSEVYYSEVEQSQFYKPSQFSSGQFSD